MPPEMQIAFYATAVALTCALTWLSGSHVLQKLSLILLMAWAASNLALQATGYAGEPFFVPTIDAGAAALVFSIGRKARSEVSRAIFVIYVLVGSVHVFAIITGQQATWNYYAVKNLLFLMQLAVLGIAGGVLSYRAVFGPGGQRSGHHSAAR